MAMTLWKIIVVLKLILKHPSDLGDMFQLGTQEVPLECWPAGHASELICKHNYCCLKLKRRNHNTVLTPRKRLTIFSNLNQV